MLYYFHLRDGVDILLDEEGRHFASVADIASASLRDVRYLIAEDAMRGRIDFNQHLDVENEAGEIVHSLEFADAVEIVPRGAQG